MSMETKCIGSKWDGWRHVSCSREASIGKYCGVHHPDKVKARREKREAKLAQAYAIRGARWDEKARRDRRRDFCETHFDALEAALRNLEAETSKLWRAAAIAQITSGIDETPIVNTVRDARAVLAKIDKEHVIGFFTGVFLWLE